MHELSVDLNSEIAVSFKKFVLGYINTQISNQLEDCGYLFYLECKGEDVSIEVFSVMGLRDIKLWSMSYVMEDANLIDIVKFFSSQGVEIDSIFVLFNRGTIKYIFLNKERESLDFSKDGTESGYYITNKETGKIELHFSEDAYKALSDEEKSMIKKIFLFSGKKKIWVSRAKFPNLWRAEETAKKLGLRNDGKLGEMLSFEEQMARKAERAEARAERYEQYSENAKKRGDELQKPLNDMHGDIAFFTQSNINSSSGRAFSRRRERMFEAYGRGFEEFRKSEYYADKAEAARATASSTKPTDKSFCTRRIEEAEKTIKAQKKNLETYKGYLDRINKGEILRLHNQEVLTEEKVLDWVDRTEDIIEQAISKSVYYHECLEELGGVEFSRDNIKKGYIIEHRRWGRCQVGGTGPKNITYVILDGGAAGMGGKASYSEIVRVISSKVPEKVVHPFVIGDTFSVEEWDTAKNSYMPKTYEVVKVTHDRVTLKSGSDRAISRKPERVARIGSVDKVRWALSICDGRNGTVYKNENNSVVE